MVAIGTYTDNTCTTTTYNYDVYINFSMGKVSVNIRNPGFIQLYIMAKTGAGARGPCDLISVAICGTETITGVV